MVSMDPAIQVERLATVPLTSVLWIGLPIGGQRRFSAGPPVGQARSGPSPGSLRALASQR
jgi:hypothetical protein